MDYYKEENSNEFILAVRSKDSVLSFLLRRGTVEQLNYSNDNGYTALHFASFHGNLSLLRFLERHGGDIFCENHHKLNLIHVAA